MCILTLIRGLPGSGKTIAASLLGQPVFEADDYFVDAFGNYQFDRNNLHLAHQACQMKARFTLEAKKSCCIANTLSTKFEVECYLAIAARTGARVSVVDLFDGGCSVEELARRNRHSVPLSVINNMKRRWWDAPEISDRMAVKFSTIKYARRIHSDFK